jgi:RING-H2 zinc finger protein RHA1
MSFQIMFASFRKVVFNYLRRSDDNDQPEDEDRRPSPSLVAVPFHLISESIKKKLPILQYVEFLKRRGSSACIADADDDNDPVCVVCMNHMEASDEVRELCNCSHVFHVECLDLWIGQGQETCPLCRSKLLPVQKEQLQLGEDPWRMERMVYLFGEDFDFGVLPTQQ